jgi:hypothetical protein
MLKNADFVPEEVQLLKDMQTIREEIRSRRDDVRKKELSKTLQDKNLSYNLLMERSRRVR